MTAKQLFDLLTDLQNDGMNLSEIHLAYPSCQDRNVTDKYKYCNHHHELTDEHEIVDFGDGEFVANKAAIPILKALNEAGLKTRTHHMDGNGGFISILLSDKVECEIQLVNEIYAERIRYNGMKEVLIKWSN